VTDRRTFIGRVGGALFAAPLNAFAQQQPKVWRIGFLAGGSRPPSLESSLYGGFPQGMRDLGYVEGSNLVIEWRFADGNFERLPGLAAELVRLKVDVIVTSATVAGLAAKKVTTTVPIVMAYSADPVRNGLVASLARPGGNITGLSGALPDITPKGLELLLTAVPSLSRVAILLNPSNPNSAVSLPSAQDSAQRAGVTLLKVEARTPEELESAFTAIVKERVGAVLVVIDAFFLTRRQQIAEFAIKNRLATIFANREYVEAGGLMSYGESVAEFMRRAATYVDKILKGAKPAELPIEQPTRFYLVINLKTAKALGLTIPQSLLLRADEVIQ